MNKLSSPNFNERAAGVAVEYIVLHYTGMKDAASALARLCDAAAGVSAHYVIDEDGTVTRLVDEDRRAWHAGKSFWRGVTDLNSASVGIELVNPGHDFGYRPFAVAQIAALGRLLREIMARHGMKAATCLLAHSDIAPSRKEDPGELFPWQELARQGLGVWPEVVAGDDAAASAGEVSALLGRIGYDVSVIEDALLAFQRRYYPENLDGVATAATVARLRAVSRVIG